MGLINHLFGNATEVNLEELRAEFAPILIPEEELESAFRIFRDKWVFTTKRLIMLDVQGVTGSKREYHSIPYKSIEHFSVETAGTLDDDCEMKIWVRGLHEPIKKEFKRDIDVRGLSKVLAEHVING